MNELPLYRCHKTVRAAKVRQVFYEPGPKFGATLQLEIPSTTKPMSLGDFDNVTIERDGSVRKDFTVAQEFIEKHKPQVGGYLVIYDDGYQSFSPAKAFEEGYTLEA